MARRRSAAVTPSFPALTPALAKPVPPKSATRIAPATQITLPTVRGYLAVAVATLLLISGSVVAWCVYDGWRQGRIELTTDGEPVVGQVLAESSDDPIGEPFDLVSRAVLSLPAGEYRLRVTGKGRLSRTYRFAVNRGETQTHTISIDEGRLLGGEYNPDAREMNMPRQAPIPFPPVIAALELTPGKSDLIEWSQDSLARRDGASAGSSGTCFTGPCASTTDATPPTGCGLTTCRARSSSPRQISTATAHATWYCFFPMAQAFLALSGADGSMLWNYVAELDGPGGARPQGIFWPGKDRSTSRWTYITGTPVVTDVDNDGTADLIATVVFSETPQETGRRTEATPGLGAPEYRNVPPAYDHGSLRRIGPLALELSARKNLHQHTSGVLEASPALVQHHHETLVAVTEGPHWLGLDPAKGRLKAGPFDLGFAPLGPVEHADLDGDGEPEILAMRPGPLGGQLKLHAFSINKGREIWAETIVIAYDAALLGGPESSCPLAVDLDSDGRAEVVAAGTGAMPPLPGYRGVRLLDGLTGKARWTRPMRPDTKAPDGVVDVIAAPDLDGDGTREVIAVSLFKGKNPAPAPRTGPEEPERVYVDALSGKNGLPLWWWSADLPFPGRFTRFWKPQWWGRGPDGWPLLAVPVGGRHPEAVEAGVSSSHVNPPILHLLEATTGRERHTIDGLNRASFADLNGDGLADLWGEVDGELRAFRGEAAEAWRASAGLMPPAHTMGVSRRP